MKTITVSTKGQVAIPKDVRAHLNIQAGDTLAVSVEGGKLVMEPTVSIPKSQAWFWTKEVQERIREADEDYRNGDYMKFRSADELIAFLNARDNAR